jgi:hypothetical protein
MGRQKRSDQPDASAGQIQEELTRLREQLTVELNSRKLISTSRFAEEITARIPVEKPTSSTTAWRWLEGRSMPSRTMLEKLRVLSASLKHSVGSFEDAPKPSVGQIEDVCRRIRIKVLGELMVIAPHVLREAEEVAISAETFLVSLSAYTRVTEADAEAALRKMIAAGLPKREASVLKPPFGYIVGEAISDAQIEIQNAWHVNPTNLVVKSALLTVERAAELRERFLLGPDQG